MAYDALTTLEATKTWLSKAQSQTASDPQITQLIGALSAEVGRYCGRDNLGNVLTYTERYGVSGGGKVMTRNPRVLLRHYPVVAITQVQLDNTIIPLTTDPTGCTSGAYLDPNGLRTLELFGYRWCVPLVVTYTAGYQPLAKQAGPASTIPPDLVLVVQQWINEILQSRQQTNQKSQSLGGQTVSFDQGEHFGMSPRTLAMLQPHINRVPLYGA